MFSMCRSTVTTASAAFGVRLAHAYPFAPGGPPRSAPRPSAAPSHRPCLGQPTDPRDPAAGMRDVPWDLRLLP